MDHFHSYRVINVRILLTRNKLNNSRNHPLPDYRRRVGKDLALIVSALWKKEQCSCLQTSLYASLLVSAFLCPGREEESALESGEVVVSWTPAPAPLWKIAAFWDRLVWCHVLVFCFVVVWGWSNPGTSVFSSMPQKAFSRGCCKD